MDAKKREDPDKIPSSKTTPESIREKAIDQIKTVYDPEIPVDIWELGLIYELEVTDELDVRIKMTLTSPFCPVAESLPREVAQKVQDIEGVRDVDIEMVFMPAWSKEMISEEARWALGF